MTPGSVVMGAYVGDPDLACTTANNGPFTVSGPTIDEGDQIWIWLWLGFRKV